MKMKQSMKIAALTILYILFAVHGYSQKINGTVKDTTGAPVRYATVNLKDSISNTILTYTITDSKGNFALQIPGNISVNSLRIEVRSLGYEAAVKNIAAFNIPVDFVLRI